MSIETTTTETTNVPSDPMARPIPVIKPENVFVNIAGQRSRWIEVHLPQDCTFGDLADPRPWRKVQANTRSSLRRGDHPEIFAADGSWMATAMVTEATGTGITLTKPNKVEMRSGAHRLFETAEYAMRWTSAGFEIVRRSDEVVVVPECATAEQAERELWLRYPRRVQ